jgi:hypothetical protein
MTSNGFVAESNAYTVTYSDPGKRQLLPPDWMLDNFFQDGAGQPTEMKTDGNYESHVDWIWPDGSRQTLTLVTRELGQ